MHGEPFGHNRKFYKAVRSQQAAEETVGFSLFLVPIQFQFSIL